MNSSKLGCWPWPKELHHDRKNARNLKHTKTCITLCWQTYAQILSRIRLLSEYAAVTLLDFVQATRRKAALVQGSSALFLDKKRKTITIRWQRLSIDMILRWVQAVGEVATPSLRTSVPGPGPSRGIGKQLHGLRSAWTEFSDSETD